MGVLSRMQQILHENALLMEGTFYEIPPRMADPKWAGPPTVAVNKIVDLLVKDRSTAFVVDEGGVVDRFGRQWFEREVLKALEGWVGEERMYADEAEDHERMAKLTTQLDQLRSASVSFALIKSPKSGKQGYRVTLKPALSKI